MEYELLHIKRVIEECLWQLSPKTIMRIHQLGNIIIFKTDSMQK